MRARPAHLRQPGGRHCLASETSDVWNIIRHVSAHREAHVVPATGASWEVVEPGAASPHSRHSTQRDAIHEAKELLHQRGGGETVVHGRDGRIVESDRVGGGTKPARSS